MICTNSTVEILRMAELKRYLLVSVHMGPIVYTLTTGRHIVYMKVHFELMKCINDQLTRAKHASRSAAEASILADTCTRLSQNQRSTSDSECADFGRMASESIFVTTRVIALSVSFGEKSCTSGVTQTIELS